MSLKGKPLLVLGVNCKLVFSLNNRLDVLLDGDQVKLLSLIKSKLTGNILNLENICYFNDLQKEKYKIEIINGNFTNEPPSFEKDKIFYPTINNLILEKLNSIESLKEIDQNLASLDLSKDDIFHEDLSNKQYLERLGEKTISDYPVLAGYYFLTSINEKPELDFRDYQGTILASFGTLSSTALKDWIFFISDYAKNTISLGKKYIDDIEYSQNIKVASLSLPEISDSDIDDILNQSNMLSEAIKKTKEGILLNPQRSYFAIFKAFFLTGIKERCYELNREFEAGKREL